MTTSMARLKAIMTDEVAPNATEVICRALSLGLVPAAYIGTFDLEALPLRLATELQLA